MFAFVFCFFFTVGSTALILGIPDQLTGADRALAMLFPLAGVIATVATWRAWRRRRSLRVEQHGDTTWYVWTELDGRERRSTRDPREDWDTDGGGDGAGDGGGGGD